ncbi:hypothetical protein GCM10010308_18930 [Streptomyces vinaceusdrappus]|nr:hypothetical protein GCM10010301_39590 [Streptomyces plicatus]GHC06069.1 hypothetical protein GCM10010308_18930 [Streptomyces vinaceusdrappus]
MYAAHSALTGFSRSSGRGPGAGEAFTFRAATAATPAAHSTAHTANRARRPDGKGFGIRASYEGRADGHRAERGAGVTPAAG